MKRSVTLVAVMISSLLVTSNAYAIFDAQLLLGQRSGTVAGTDGEDDADAKSQEVGVAVHVDPIPMIPLAFGLYANSMTFEKTDDGALSEGKGLEAGFQLYGWFPVGIAGLKPYAKLGIPLYSALTYEDEVDDGNGGTVKIDALFETSGMHINFGVGYSPIPMMAILFEIGLGQQKLKPSELEIGGQKVDMSAAGLKETDYKSTSYSIGIEVGL